MELDIIFTTSADPKIDLNEVTSHVCAFRNSCHQSSQNSTDQVLIWVILTFFSNLLFVLFFLGWISQIIGIPSFFLVRLHGKYLCGKFAKFEVLVLIINSKLNPSTEELKAGSTNYLECTFGAWSFSKGMNAVMYKLIQSI